MLEFIVATLNAYATRFTMNFQIIARNLIIFLVYKLIEPRSSGNADGHQVHSSGEDTGVLPGITPFHGITTGYH